MRPLRDFGSKFARDCQLQTGSTRSKPGAAHHRTAVEGSAADLAQHEAGGDVLLAVEVGQVDGEVGPAGAVRVTGVARPRWRAAPTARRMVVLVVDDIVNSFCW